jgi:hypothetical protein
MHIRLFDRTFLPSLCTRSRVREWLLRKHVETPVRGRKRHHV